MRHDRLVADRDFVNGHLVEVRFKPQTRGDEKCRRAGRLIVFAGMAEDALDDSASGRADFALGQFPLALFDGELLFLRDAFCNRDAVRLAGGGDAHAEFARLEFALGFGELICTS